jgi:glycerol-3-phosphate transporter
MAATLPPKDNSMETENKLPPEKFTAFLQRRTGANRVMPILADNFVWFWSYVVVAGLSVFAAIGYLILAKREEQVIKA